MAEVNEFRHDSTGRVIRAREGTRLQQLVTAKGSGWTPVEPVKRGRRKQQEPDEGAENG